jgi:hypothetical protein
LARWLASFTIMSVAWGSERAHSPPPTPPTCFRGDARLASGRDRLQRKDAVASSAREAAIVHGQRYACTHMLRRGTPRIVSVHIIRAGPVMWWCTWEHGGRPRAPELCMPPLGARLRRLPGHGRVRGALEDHIQHRHPRGHGGRMVLRRSRQAATAGRKIAVTR